MAKYSAFFEPQVWLKDNALAVDPQGPQSWDCTRMMQSLEDWRGDGSEDWHLRLAMGDEILDSDDDFKRDEDAPEWVQQWPGPFSIWIKQTEWDERESLRATLSPTAQLAVSDLCLICADVPFKNMDGEELTCMDCPLAILAFDEGEVPVRRPEKP